ncbi:hypothetical protein GQ43DRAFT_442951 [Delitschia confertaspora ATCC 74209]|uniref:Uncharacterized protein n=1 Tax=Delitschia confertaspora ATCC 74209 TaxID=1513339 RepID=A0A9P4MQ29_9PLEO|nr:hypothetical protein GQ43DRAFT_442951 [Delitschia confertaspora ATCC 74209]
MRHALIAPCLFALALGTPHIFANFLEPLLQGAHDNETLIEDGDGLGLIKRQSTCTKGYNACAYIGASGLCCKSDTVCSADAAGHVACCPLRAACTGTIVVGGGNLISSTPSNPFQTGGSTIPFVTASTTAAVGGGAIIFPSTTPTPTTTGGFVQNPTGATSFVHSTVSNAFYPFPYIPTTYTNAAACSSAYTSCQADANSCLTALASGVQGVTISAPNGGATVTAIASLGPQSASQVCQSLSSQACYGLQVNACQAFGNGRGNQNGAAKMGCRNLYEIVAGLAVGVAGQMLR